jgi:hypothetical protein
MQRSMDAEQGRLRQLREATAARHRAEASRPTQGARERARTTRPGGWECPRCDPNTFAVHKGCPNCYVDRHANPLPSAECAWT